MQCSDPSYCPFALPCPLGHPSWRGVWCHHRSWVMWTPASQGRWMSLASTWPRRSWSWTSAPCSGWSAKNSLANSQVRSSSSSPSPPRVSWELFFNPQSRYQSPGFFSWAALLSGWYQEFCLGKTEAIKFPFQEEHAKGNGEADSEVVVFLPEGSWEGRLVGVMKWWGNPPTSTWEMSYRRRSLFPQSSSLWYFSYAGGRCCRRTRPRLSGRWPESWSSSGSVPWGHPGSATQSFWD